LVRVYGPFFVTSLTAPAATVVPMSRIANLPSSGKSLNASIASGFEFVCEKAGLTFFRRVKRIAIAGTPINKRENDLVNL